MTITYKEKEYTREDIQDMIKYGYNELVVRTGWYLLSMLDKKREDEILGVVDND